MRIELTDAGRKQYPKFRSGAELIGWETEGRKWVLRIRVDGQDKETLWHPSWWKPVEGCVVTEDGGGK